MLWPSDEKGKLETYMRCRWCGIWHRHVEAGGWWHCPNPTCLSPGAAYWRHQMPSYLEIEKSTKHTVDPSDQIAAGEKKMTEHPDDAELTASIQVGIAYLGGDETAFDRNKARWQGIKIPKPGDVQAPARLRFARIVQEMMEEER